jgi:hypothetical protein
MEPIHHSTVTTDPWPQFPEAPTQASSSKGNSLKLCPSQSPGVG